MARDGLKALNAPAILTPDEIDLTNENERGKLLVSSDRVVGVELGGEARAYPLRLLQMARVGQRCRRRAAHRRDLQPALGRDRGVGPRRRRIGNRTRGLGLAAQLQHPALRPAERGRDLEPVASTDRRGRHRPGGRANTGRAAGRTQHLGRLAAGTPRTTVMAPDADSKSKYKRDPYHSYRGSDILRFPVEPLAARGPPRPQGPRGDRHPRRPRHRLCPALSRARGGREDREMGGLARRGCLPHRIRRRARHLRHRAAR